MDYSEITKRILKQLEDSTASTLKAVSTIKVDPKLVEAVSAVKVSPEVLKAVQKTQSALPKILAGMDSMKRATESIIAINTILAKAAKFLSAKGWWLIGSLSIDFYKYLVEHQQEITGEKLTNYFVTNFNKDDCIHLKEMVEGWTIPAFQNRQTIFKDALWAHQNERYTLTVPALIIQVEGIIRQYIKDTDNFTDYNFPKVKDYFSLQYLKDMDKDFAGYKLEEVKEQFKTRVSDIESIPDGSKVGFADFRALINYYNLEVLEKIFAKYDPGKHEDPDHLMRHAISHGLWITYANIENSTKLFLLLDMLHSMLMQLERKRNNQS